MQERLAKAPTKPDPLVYNRGEQTVIRIGGINRTEDDLLEELNDLIARGVFRAGLRPRCPYCRVATWIRIDELRQQLTCPGCGHQFHLHGEGKWQYRLNTLVQMAVTQGVAPVLLTLADLARDATSFIMSPNLSVYRTANATEIWHEVDVVCVREGKFIIGEAKRGSLKPSDVKDLEEVAELIRPDVVLFASSSEKLPPPLQTCLRETATRLSSLGVSVEVRHVQTV